MVVLPLQLITGDSALLFVMTQIVAEHNPPALYEAPISPVKATAPPTCKDASIVPVQPVPQAPIAFPASCALTKNVLA